MPNDLSFRDKVASWDKVASKSKTAALGMVDDLLIAQAMTGQGGLKGPGTYILGAASAVSPVSKGPLDTLSYRLNRWFHGGLGGLLNRVKADEAFTTAIVGDLATRTVDIIGDAVSKSMKAVKERQMLSPMRHAIINQLKREDDIIAAAPNKRIFEAYHTMSEFAPTLSTDKNAVKSFLREAAQHEGGIDFMSIKGLADAEAAVTGIAYKGYKK